MDPYMLNTLNDMKIRILRSDKGKWYHNTDNISKEFRVIDYYDSSILRFLIEGGSWVDKNDCVITDLPESFCVKRCDDTAKWKKYIDWMNLNSNRNSNYIGTARLYYGFIDKNFKGDFDDKPFGTEIHIDDMIKHIDFYSEPMVVESEEEKKMETNILELIRLFPELPTDYAKELVIEALKVKNGNLIHLSKFINTVKNTLTTNYNIIPGNLPDNKADYVWRKINDFKNKEEIMETQRLSRQGLKEIHSVACASWKSSLELLGANNPLEDYIELNQDQIDAMFKACTSSQLPIVSKYLKQDDGSVNVTGSDICGNDFIGIRCFGKYADKSFYLSDNYNWEIKTDDAGELCLIPTKKKQSLTSSGPSTGVGVVSTATGYTNSTTGKYSVGF